MVDCGVHIACWDTSGKIVLATDKIRYTYYIDAALLPRLVERFKYAPHQVWNEIKVRTGGKFEKDIING
jgi:hypothetical protein